MTGGRGRVVGPPAPDWLERLLAGVRADVARQSEEVPLPVVERRAREAEPSGRVFVSALSGHDRANVIAECKRRSPSRGWLLADLDAGALAAAYERGGAAAVSVVTEPLGFGGSIDDLSAARAAVRLPLLRKDFILTDYQLLEARAAGADAVLLLAAALDGVSLASLVSSARDLELAALVEVHDEGELEAVLDLGPLVEVVGVNCRNLRTFEVDPRTAERLAPLIPSGMVAVAESGIQSPAQIARLAAMGYRAFLVGEALIGSGDPGGTLARWLAEVRSCG